MPCRRRNWRMLWRVLDASSTERRPAMIANIAYVRSLLPTNDRSLNWTVRDQRTDDGRRCHDGRLRPRCTETASGVGSGALTVVGSRHCRPAAAGFGGDAPAGFSGTRYAYRDWVIDELEAMDGPVDLVGHDQGSVIGQGVILARPDLVNSWVLGGGVCADDFLWHRQARIWQNIGLGEQWRDSFSASMSTPVPACWWPPALPEIDAADVAAGMDRRMFDQILPLYRSEPYLEDWAFDPTSTYPPGLVLWGRDDPTRQRNSARRRRGRRCAFPRTRVRTLVAG